VAWAEQELDAASAAFESVMAARPSDVAAIHLMAIALERDKLNEAARWATLVKGVDDGFFIYLQGDLEALRTVKTEGHLGGGARSSGHMTWQ
jgi:hypothetical protein